ncbi:cholesterol 25-hydroxylase-like protein 1, member 2 [Cyprinodon tularosa]|uniref:cholesterol 25-hydroxylase-like protein 1, member 2 n=1 Tax=Cyprinodon tularosa TaxID=77115 RepID=UPI0018E1DA3C|nr:cholesterol 25-hydroxylase-like protein 1, member 2 [Cyprinodon tularosa]
MNNLSEPFDTHCHPHCERSTGRHSWAEVFSKPAVSDCRIRKTKKITSDLCFRMAFADNIVDIWTNYFGQNSLLQPLWDNLRLDYRDYVRSPLFPIVLTVSSYFVFCLPFLVCDIVGDRWPWVQRFKIQPSQRPTASQLLHCAGVTLYNHVFLLLPASVAQWLWRPPADLPDQAPALLELIVGVIGNLLLFDFQYFIWHLLHHRIRWLYVTFHAIHHRKTSVKGELVLDTWAEKEARQLEV